jgi:hypothetical protein
MSRSSSASSEPRVIFRKLPSSEPSVIFRKLGADRDAPYREWFRSCLGDSRFPRGLRQLSVGNNHPLTAGDGKPKVIPPGAAPRVKALPPSNRATGRLPTPASDRRFPRVVRQESLSAQNTRIPWKSLSVGSHGRARKTTLGRAQTQVSARPEITLGRERRATGTATVSPRCVRHPGWRRRCEPAWGEAPHTSPLEFGGSARANHQGRD